MPKIVANTNPTSTQGAASIAHPTIATPKAAGERQVKMNSTPALEAKDSAGKTVGPATAAYARELAELESAVAAGAADVNARIQKMFTSYGVEGYARALSASTLLPGPEYGTAISDPGHTINYGLDGIRPTDFDLPDYYTRLHGLAAKVAQGELSPDEARQRAARPAWSALRGAFHDHAGFEIANCDERRGVMLCYNDDKSISVMTTGEFKPDYYDLSKHTWRDLASAITLDPSFAVVAVDPFAARPSYDSALRLLRYVGDIARFRATLPNPTPPVDPSDG